MVVGQLVRIGAKRARQTKTRWFRKQKVPIQLHPPISLLVCFSSRSGVKNTIYYITAPRFYFFLFPELRSRFHTIMVEDKSDWKKCEMGERATCAYSMMQSNICSSIRSIPRNGEEPHCEKDREWRNVQPVVGRSGSCGLGFAPLCRQALSSKNNIQCNSTSNNREKVPFLNALFVTPFLHLRGRLLWPENPRFRKKVDERKKEVRRVRRDR